jgi:hypothetical protein
MLLKKDHTTAETVEDPLTFVVLGADYLKEEK